MEYRQYCTFFLENLFLGIEVMKVQEVIRYQEMTRVPLAHPVLRGLINLRGQIVPALDLRKRLNMKDRDSNKFPMNVVVRSSEGVLSLLVDEIGDVLEVPEDQFEVPPDTVDKETRELIQGVFKLDGKLLLVLDTEKAINLQTEVSSSASPIKELAQS